MEIIYKAKDCTLWQSESACIEQDKYTELFEHVQEWCPVTFHDDFRCNIIEVDDVVRYIRENIYDICKILDK